MLAPCRSGTISAFVVKAFELDVHSTVRANPLTHSCRWYDATDAYRTVSVNAPAVGATSEQLATNVTDGPSPKTTRLVSPARVPTNVPGVRAQVSSSRMVATGAAAATGTEPLVEGIGPGLLGAAARPLSTWAVSVAKGELSLSREATIAGSIEGAG